MSALHGYKGKNVTFSILYYAAIHALNLRVLRAVIALKFKIDKSAKYAYFPYILLDFDQSRCQFQL